MAWGWYLPLGLLALLAVISLLRCGVGLSYDDGGLRLWLVLGPLRPRLLPREPRERKKAAASGKPKRAAKRKPSAPKDPQRSLTLEELLEYVRFGLHAVGRMARLLRIDQLTLHAVVGTEDAAQTALAYGAASAALSGLYPALAARTKIRRQDLSLEADFTGGHRLEGTIQVSSVILCMGIAALSIAIQFLKLRKQQTGKAVTT